MARYRSLPATCEAEQFHEPKDLLARSAGTEASSVHGGKMPELPRGVLIEHRRSGPPVYYVITAHGQRAYLADGDYVVEEPDGRGFYPVKPDIFGKRWETAGISGMVEGPAREIRSSDEHYDAETVKRDTIGKAQG